MKVKAFFTKDFKVYEVQNGRYFIDFYESPAMNARPISDFDNKFSLAINSKRYYIYTSGRTGEQYAFTEDFIELMQSMRPYSQGDENSFVLKMRKKILEREKHENNDKVSYKREEI